MEQITLLTLIIGLAALLALVMKRLNQPILVSYLVVGAILSAFHIVKPEQLSFLSILPEIGLALLLFLVGMELDFQSFKSLGIKVGLVTVFQVAFTTALMAAVFQGFFGLTFWSAVTLGLALSISSTIIIIKLLYERRELPSLHGKMSVGISLVEDLIAVGALMVLTAVTGQGVASGMMFGLIAIKGIALLVLSLFAGKKILPHVFRLTADNGELLFLTAVAWCLAFVALASFLGFSLAIGAFLAGVSLAQSVYRIQISGKIKPLRDFFIMLFFLDLGTGLSISGIGSFFPLALTLWLYALIIKPLVFFLILVAVRFKAHPAFKTAIYISSISEFSLILVAQTAKAGLISPTLLSPLIFATVISFISSSLIASKSRWIYARLRPVLKPLEMKKSVADSDGEVKELTDHAILIGCHRSGEIILARMKKIFGENLIVVDFSPDVIDKLQKEGIPSLYGDMTDPEVYEQLNLKEAKIVVSTIRDIDDNLALLDIMNQAGSKAAVIISAADNAEALKLYEKGAHHVSLPTDLEGASISNLVTDNGNHLRSLMADKKEKLEQVKKIHQEEARGR
jgi:Kef-type K+ transport system membrane component KefB/Trk K+ transport system NAD-binding subunit